MRKKVLAVCLVILMMLASSASYALPSTAKEAHLWAPETMLKGKEYEVLITLVGFSEEYTHFTLVSNDQSIVSVMERNVAIEPYKSHGITKVKANSPGRAEIFAISGDLLIKRSVTVVEPALTPSQLDLILPENISTRTKVPAYVFLTDSFNNPLLAEEDIEVAVTSFGYIKPMVNQTVIRAGTHYATFPVIANGDGGISVLSNGFGSDSFETSMNQLTDDIEFRVEVAPNPAATSSAAEVYAWLEKDGTIYVPDEDINVTFVSEDSRFLGFSKSIHFSQPSDRDILSTGQTVIKKGMSYAHITAWTAEAEIPEGFEKRITIMGLAEGYDGDETEVVIKQPVSTDPNVTRVFVLPDPAGDSVDIIVALYFDEQLEEEATGVDVQEVIESLDDQEELQELAEELELEVSGDLEPVFVGDRLYANVATSSLLKPESTKIRMDRDDLDLRDQYTIVHAKSTGLFGTANVFAAVDGTLGEIINIDIENIRVNAPRVSITSLPVLANVKQDLFIVSGSHEGVANVEFKNLFLGTKPKAEIEDIEINGSIAIVKGRALDAASQGKLEVNAISEGMRGVNQTVTVFNPSIRNLVALSPSMVHVGEHFPIVFYSADQNGNPIEKIEPRMSTASELGRVSGGIFFISSNSDHNIIFYDEDINPVTAQITSFANEISLKVDASDTTVKHGGKILLKYDVMPSDSDVALQSDLPFTRDGNKFVIEADDVGKKVLKVTASREGFSTVTKEISIDVQSLAAATRIDAERAGEDEDSYESIPVAADDKFGSVFALIGVVVAAAGGALYLISKKKQLTLGSTEKDDMVYFCG
jgi:hypothetical protein